jgi:hypothetical protein
MGDFAVALVPIVFIVSGIFAYFAVKRHWKIADFF